MGKLRKGDFKVTRFKDDDRIYVDYVRQQIRWAEHEILHTNKKPVDILYEAFEEVMKE